MGGVKDDEGTILFFAPHRVYTLRVCCKPRWHYHLLPLNQLIPHQTASNCPPLRKAEYTCTERDTGARWPHASDNIRQHQTAQITPHTSDPTCSQTLLFSLTTQGCQDKVQQRQVRTQIKGTKEALYETRHFDDKDAYKTGFGSSTMPVTTIALP